MRNAQLDKEAAELRRENIELSEAADAARTGMANSEEASQILLTLLSVHSLLCKYCFAACERAFYQRIPLCIMQLCTLKKVQPRSKMSCPYAHGHHAEL